MNHSDRIPYRIFWTWDHSTNWCMHEKGSQNSGVANPYTKQPEFFEMDYRRAVDWCASHGMDAVGIVGLLRDSHGGVDSVRRLCGYARERGVRIYAIAGLYAYGGIYYEGDHPYSLNRYFEKNPGAVGKQEDGSPLIVTYRGRMGYKDEPQGCPSDPALNDFVLESLDWLFREIPELGGIQMEAGDSGICQCPKCRAKRGPRFLDPWTSLSDMSRIYPQAAEAVLRRSPDAWVICETYHHFLDDSCGFFKPENDSPELQAIQRMPENVFWQWKCDARLQDGTWREGDRLPGGMLRFRHVMRAHSGTQWWGSRHQPAVDKIRRQCRLSFDAGLDAVSLFGEGAPFHTGAEMNYLALQYYADHPLAPLEAFVCDVMAPLLGGEEYARRFLSLSGTLETPDRIPDAAREIAKITSGIRDWEILRRWQYLASYLNGFAWEAKQRENMEDPDRQSIG